MAGLVDKIRSELQDGFELEFYKEGAGKGIYRLLKNGKPYLERGLKQITVSDSSDSHHYRRRVQKQLEDIGALPMPYRGKTHTPEPERVTNYAVPVKTAMEAAREILKDVRSTPRERKMAKAYLDLVAKYIRVTKLAQRLNKAQGAGDTSR